jgi:acetyl esterase/lipase
LLIAGKRLSKVPEFFSNASPWHRVGDHAPPFFVIHGAMDSLAIVEEARGFVDRLKAVSQQPVVYAELPRAQHAFDQFLSIRTLNAVRGIARFGRWAFERSAAATDAHPDRPSDQASRSPTSSS